ncbi:hypothetical protein BS78_K190100, partial [Paspalum vaginatum]
PNPRSPPWRRPSAITGGTVTGHYVYQVDRCSRTKQEVPSGRCIVSPSFSVGGYSWRISCYPNGLGSYCADYVSVFLVLGCAVAEPVKARTRFSLLDRAGRPVPGHSQSAELIEYFKVGVGHGLNNFIKREFLERRSISPAPLSDLQRHLGNLLVAKEGADITVRVAGEEFSAHRCVLAARSPVLKAEILGAANTVNCIQIDGMPAHVFKALLHFIYTDSLPEMTGQQESEMVEPSIQTADSYNIQRLKLICEKKLSRDVNEDTVAKMLRLAAQHHCLILRKACVEFLQGSSAMEAIMVADDGLFEMVAKSCPALLKELARRDYWPVHEPG